MKVCVVGSGAREHALADALARHHDVVVTPGNAGIDWSTSDSPEDMTADLYVVGPEGPLVDGLADRLRADGALVFGPGRDGARLEGSKAWMKQLLVDAGVPTARHGTFSEPSSAVAFLDELDGSYVVKTDGLAAGKGVLVTADRAEAEAAVRSYLSGDAFGEAGRTVVVEEGLVGPELSVFALCDGRQAVLFAWAQDFKRVGDGDTGPNTGGMGAYWPVPVADEALLDEIMRTCLDPTVAELQRRGIDYRGVLFAGLMLTPDGPRMLEYNVRFGDPEAQVIFPRLTNDLGELLRQAAAGDLRDQPTFDDGAAVTVVCAAAGYPVSPRVGDVISGIDAARDRDGVSVFAAGVARRGDDLVTAGGRVVAVTGTGPTVDVARARAYGATDLIEWSGKFVRRDIAASVEGVTR